MTLEILKYELSVCRLDPGVLPDWALVGELFSITQRGDQELSVVCESRCVPDAGVVAESGWRALGVQGLLDFGLTGVLAKLSAVIAEVEISIFAISTYDTDLVLVKADKLENAVRL